MPIMPLISAISTASLPVIYFICIVLCGYANAGESLTPVTSAISAPRIIRYLSSEDPFAGRECFGVVHSDNNGIPTSIINMGSLDSSLCSTAGTELPVDRLKTAFELAERKGLHKISASDELLIEKMHTHELAKRILPPVPITIEQLVKEQRFIISTGLNYAKHNVEVGKDEPVLFAKLVAPTGAYQEVRTGLQLDEENPTDVKLLDYEIELAVVFLEEVDLTTLRDPDSFRDSIAFFISNDISDRKPIILDDKKEGFTKGKSHPTYLPTGPWMIHGRHIHLMTSTLQGKDNLQLRLKVFDRKEENETAPSTDSRLAQNDTTSSMILGPREIVEYLARKWQDGKRISMPDAQGEPRYIHTKEGIIPAGSILLTGTPGGTAITKPKDLEKSVLFVKGGLSKQGARKQFTHDSEENSDKLGYLQPGDTVEAWISGLGRQLWHVVSSVSSAL